MSDAPKTQLLVDTHGSLTERPIEDAQGLATLGYVPASAAQVKEFELNKKYSTLPEELKAFGEGAAQAATLGLSTPIEVALGANPQAIAARERIDPLAHGAGTVAAFFPSLLSGVGEAEGALGAARAVAEGAPGLLSKAGKLIGEGTEGLLGAAEGPLTRGATYGTKIAGELASGATQGAAYGAGQVVHESALGDPNLAAQSHLAEIGLSAALGGGLGGLAGLGEVGIPELVDKAKNAVSGAFRKGEGALKDFYTSAAGEAATGTPGDVAGVILEHRLELEGLEQQVPGITEALPSATPEMANWMVANGSRLAQMEQAFPGTVKQLGRLEPETADIMLNNWPKIMTDPKVRMGVATNLRQGMQGVLSTTGNLLRRVNSELAPNEEEELLSSVQHAIRPQAKEAYAQTFEKMEGAIAKMRAQPDLYNKGYAAQLEQIRDGFVRDVAAVPQNLRMTNTLADDPLQVFRRLKTLRQQLDENIKYGRDAKALGISDRNGNNVLKELRDHVKSTLTDEGTFGEAAARKAALDDVQHSWLKLTGKGGDFRKAFLDADGNVVSSRVDTWLNSLAKDAGGEKAEAIGQMMATAKQVAKEAEASWKSAPTGKFDAEALQSLFDKTSQNIAEARQAGEVTATKKYLDSGGVGIPNSGPVTPGIGEKALHFVFPRITSIVRGATNMAKTVKSVPRAVAVLTQLERAGQSISRQIDRGVDALVRSSHEAIGATSPIAATLSNHDEHAALLNSLIASPEAMQQKLETQVADIQPHAPRTAQALALATARMVSYLHANLPQPMKLSPLGPTLKPSKNSMARYNRIRGAAEKPTSILGRAELGMLTPEENDAVRATSPELHAKMQSAILDRLAEHGEKTIPYRSRLGMSLIMGQPLDGTTSQQAIAANQLIYSLPSAKGQDSQTGPAALRPTQTGLAKLTVSNRSMLPGQAAESRRGEA